MRVGDAQGLHVIERVADVVDGAAALADALRHQARASVQVELAHVRRMRWVCEESERATMPAAASGGISRRKAVRA